MKIPYLTERATWVATSLLVLGLIGGFVLGALSREYGVRKERDEERFQKWRMESNDAICTADHILGYDKAPGWATMTDDQRQEWRCKESNRINALLANEPRRPVTTPPPIYRQPFD